MSEIYTRQQEVWNLEFVYLMAVLCQQSRLIPRIAISFAITRNIVHISNLLGRRASITNQYGGNALFDVLCVSGKTMAQTFVDELWYSTEEMRKTALHGNAQPFQTRHQYG